VRSNRVLPLLTATVALGLAVAGCGGGSSTSTTSAASDAASASPAAAFPIDIWAGLPMDSAKSQGTYTFVDKAEKPWNICVSFPHLKDAYWVGAAYGLAEQAKASGVNMTLVEAGGYENLDKQIQQVENCMQNNDALILGSISFDGLNASIDKLKAAGKPTIDLINGVSATSTTARSVASFNESATASAEWIKTDSGGKPVKVGWFPGPKGAGFAEDANAGFVKAATGSNITIVDTKWGDTGKESQAKLVENLLQAHPDIQYIAGTAVTAEAAGPILKDKGLADKIKSVTYYFSPGAYQGIKDGSVAAAPSDSQVNQARMAIDLAIRALEKKDHQIHVAPQLIVIDKTNIDTFPVRAALAPDGWSPIFSVKAK
jgi:protein TorT